MYKMDLMRGDPEAVEFFRQLDAKIVDSEDLRKEKQGLKDIRKQIKREKKRDADILTYCNEHNLDNSIAKEIRDTQIILEESEKLDINNPLECMLYNQMMAGLDATY